MENKDINYTFTGAGLTKEERKKAKKRFYDYKDRYSIESISDLPLLENLVFREALQERIQIKMEELSKNDIAKSANIIPVHILNSLNENLDQILILKEKLGLFEKKEENDAFKALEILEKKFKIWLEENSGSRTLICPFCSKPIMLLIKTDAWEALKHPFFKDKMLFNKEAWKLYKSGKITKLELAKILQGEEITSEDYITWLESKIKFD